MATWLIAAKALRDAGAKLKGDLVLQSVVGEIGLEPVDEFQPPKFVAKEAGTRYATTHGGVADYALVSEGTDFSIIGVEAGKAFFKITVFGEDLPIYTPYINRPVPLAQNPSAIARMSIMIQAIEDWAADYEKRNRYECAGGIVVPRVNIGAIRGGVPWKITKTVQQCAIYVDVRITPAQEPMDVREDLRELLANAGLDGEVELYVFRPAFEADEKKAAPLRKAITQAHRKILGGEPKPAVIPASSMWRDLNCFNEMRIPSLCCGPGVSVGGGVFRMPIENLVNGSRLFVAIAMDLCNQPRRPAS
jgi:acetylornithine deacetylase/succinyl-diaminopimelate desuccinylase-like protein